MAVTERNMVKHITASGGGTLRAEANESFRVKDLFCLPSASDTYVTVLVGGRVVNKVRVKGKAGSHLPYPAVKVTSLSEAVIPFGLFAYLRGFGFDLTIPVPAGSILTVERFAEAGNVCLVYDRYPAGEVKADEPNGEHGRVQRYLHYATNLAILTASPAAIDGSLIWTGGDKWPFDGTAVANDFKMSLAGILAAPCARGNATVNKGYTTHVRMLKEGDMIFDSKDQVGIPFLGDVTVVADAATYTPVASLIGPMTDVQPKPGFMLVPPLEFLPGDRLTTEVVLAGAAAAGLVAAELDFCFLLEKSPRTGR